MRRRGFTLVEMVVVVAVIGVAGALAAYNMSDQVRDARARAEAYELLHTLRSEHRRAREQMYHLKVESSGHNVTYTLTRDAACTAPVSTPKTVGYDYATLSILNAPAGFACFSDRGELPTDGGGGGVPNGVGIQGPTPIGNGFGPAGDEGGPQAPTGGLVFVIEAELSDGCSELFMPVRIDPAGIAAALTARVSLSSAPDRKNSLANNVEAATDSIPSAFSGC
jgi:prepilin-type N-terminal cleavage/methylation domain-containing protein